MQAVSTFESFVIEDQFDRALKTIRSELTATDLNIVAEFDTAEVINGNPSRRPCRILLVDNPLLVFEALALDRAAAVFLPLHVVISGAGDRTEVSIANPTHLLDARFPAGAADPVDRLVGRIELALQSASERHAGAKPDGAR